MNGMLLNEPTPGRDGPTGDGVTQSENASVAHPADAAANFGLIRPPLVYLGLIGVGLVVHAFWPMQLLPDSVHVPLGILVLLMGTALFVWAVRTFRTAGTPIPGNLPTTTIVRAGPYGFSRNPIYLAFTLIHVGLAAWANSLGVLLCLLPALALMILVVIPREERYLEARFAWEYLSYKRAVRRWL
jgi:protein-S-isoprenylcysteine O-methyltransferase Ste14